MQQKKETRAYGSWSSPVSASMLAEQVVGIGSPGVDGETVTWLESRPSEGGRAVVVGAKPGASPAELIPATANARTRVHEYGGDSYAVRDGLVVYVEFADQQLYACDDAEHARRITDEPHTRFAAPQFLPGREELVAVAERHAAGREPENSLVVVELSRGTVRTLASGADFYGVPAIDPGGERLAWVEWDHPNMPWDATRLLTARLDGDGLTDARRIEMPEETSSVYPRWVGPDELLFLNDAADFWQPYRWTAADGAVERVTDFAADFCEAAWTLTQAPFAVVGDAYYGPAMIDGESHCARIDLATGRTRVEFPILTRGGVQPYGPSGNAGLLYVGGDRRAPSALIHRTADGTTRILKRASDLDVDPAYVSEAEPVSFPTTGGETAYALYYAPRNPRFAGPNDERPPLLVQSHGGPTAHVQGSFRAAIQYWTSRGIGVLDVNYRGSTGYGRRYRNLLRGRWGVYDIDDCIAGARFLVERGDVDGARVAISGGSAGGFTTIGALTFRDFFTAGVSLFGVSDLEALAKETHKFESRYLDSLVGPYPQAASVYRERSPINHTAGLSAPMILFQGEDDKVVPPSQARSMADSLRAKGIPVELVVYPGEGHGFRRAENIIRTVETTLAFLGRVYGFTSAP
ncbi:MAG: alpha/beta hydrolase family protein [Spirochaetota bacterium]